MYIGKFLLWPRKIGVFFVEGIDLESNCKGVQLETFQDERTKQMSTLLSRPLHDNRGVSREPAS